MNPAQVLLDEPLLRCLDAGPEVRKPGRSKVLRRAALDDLDRKRLRHIQESYRRAYGKASGLGSDFAGWEGGGMWPQEFNRGETWRFCFPRPDGTRPFLVLSK